MMRDLYLNLARRLLVWALQPQLRAALPRIFQRIDSEYEVWLSERCSPYRVENLMIGIITDVMKEPCRPTHLWMVRLLYDPVAAAQGGQYFRKR